MLPPRPPATPPEEGNLLPSGPPKRGGEFLTTHPEHWGLSRTGLLYPVLFWFTIRSMADYPQKLAEIVELFQSSPKMLKTDLLLEYADKMPPLPEGESVVMERVAECTTPFSVKVENQDGRVKLFFDAPKEAPTVRAFAGILAEGLNGATAEEVLAVPENFYVPMGLTEVVSPLRIRGLSAVLARIKRQVRETFALAG